MPPPNSFILVGGPAHNIRIILPNHIMARLRNGLPYEVPELLHPENWKSLPKIILRQYFQFYPSSRYLYWSNR